MGGSHSKTSVNALSESLNTIVMNTMQSCEIAADQSQNLEVVNSGFRLFGVYTLRQQSEIKADCFSDVNKQSELQNAIINEIAQSTSSQNVALLGAFGTSQSEAISNLQNIVRTNVTMSNIQRAYNQIKQQQGAKFTNSGVLAYEQADLTQGSKLFAAATLQEMDRAGVFNKISSYLDQEAAAKQENPLDFIAKAVGAVSSSIFSTILFFVFIIVAAILGLKLLGVDLNEVISGKGSAGLMAKAPLPPQIKLPAMAVAATR